MYNPKNAVRTAVLVGGGLDSHAYMVLNHQHQQMDFIHVDYGQRVARAEADAVYELADKLGLDQCRVILTKLPKDNHMTRVNQGKGVLFGTGQVEMDNAFVKGRNLFLIQQAIEMGYGEVHLTLCRERGRMFPDADFGFIELANNLMRRSYGVKVEAPYINEDKYRMMRLAYVRVPEFFDLTFTCWVDPDKECGTCPHCVKKAEIREHLNDPKSYPPVQSQEQWAAIKAGYGAPGPGVVLGQEGRVATILTQGSITVDCTDEEYNLVLEARAQEIYESWSNQEGYVPWKKNGNSKQQEHARHLACNFIKRQGE